MLFIITIYKKPELFKPACTISCPDGDLFNCCYLLNSSKECDYFTVQDHTGFVSNYCFADWRFMGKWIVVLPYKLKFQNNFDDED